MRHHSSIITIFEVSGLNPANQNFWVQTLDNVAARSINEFNQLADGVEIQPQPARFLSKTQRLACAFRASASGQSPVLTTQRSIVHVVDAIEQATGETVDWHPFMILDGYGLGLDLLQSRDQIAFKM